jgi:regulatory protein
MPPKKRWKRRSTNSNGFTSKPEPNRLDSLISEEELLTFALNELTRRPHAVAELRRKLLRHSENETLLDSIIQRLARCGYLNDRRVAESLVQSGFEQKLQGRSRIEQELASRGVAPKLAREVLETQFPRSEETAQLSRALEKKMKTLTPPPDAKKLSRLYNYLARQGFSEDAIRQELERRFGDILNAS